MPAIVISSANPVPKLIIIEIRELTIRECVVLVLQLSPVQFKTLWLHVVPGKAT